MRRAVLGHTSKGQARQAGSTTRADHKQRRPGCGYRLENPGRSIPMQNLRGAQHTGGGKG